MLADQARDLINCLLVESGQPQLNDLQTAILLQVWQGSTSQIIADQLGYRVDYINQVAARLWKNLAACLGQPVSRKNIKVVLHSYATRQTGSNSIKESTLTANSNPQATATQRRADWGESIDVSRFYGREAELETLAHWAITERCRVIGLFGLGGIGKTALSIKFAQTIQSDFQVVVWRSLRQAPSLQNLLQSLLPVLMGDPPTDLTDISIQNLLQQLHQQRCLIVLDNVESILQAGDQNGRFLPGYENYGQLLERICDEAHPSCLVLGGREKPGCFAPREGDKLPVRCWYLQGLGLTAGQQILGDKGATTNASQTQLLVDRLGGNPLALKIVASNIYNLFNNDTVAFLAQGNMVFGSLWQLLEQQFQRLSLLQQQLMYWLAIGREGISPLQLQAKLFPPVPLPQVLEALTALRDRSAIETTATGLTQQPVVMEYMIERLVSIATQELITGNLELLTRHALMEAAAPDNVRDTQVQLILYPLAQKLREHFGAIPTLVAHLQAVLNQQRQPAPEAPRLSYSAGNLVNLLCHLQIDLGGWDFSELVLRQTYLAEIPLHDTNFNDSHLRETVFAETFGAILGVTYSPNGKLLATGSSSGEVKIWDAETYQELLCCRGHKHWVFGLSFSPDSNFIASASDDYTVKLWDATTGICLQTYWAHTDSVNTVVFSPDGRLLASGAQDSTIGLLPMPQSVPGEGEPEVRILRGHQGRVWSVAFSPDGKMLASCGEDCTIRLWDVASGDCLVVWPAHDHWARSVAFSPDGQLLASCSFDQTIKLWDLQDMHQHKCLKSWVAHQSAVVAVTFSPDGLQLASASSDRTLKLWNILSCKCLRTLFGHIHGLWDIAFHPHAPRLVSGAEDHLAKIWNLQTGTCTKTLMGHSNAVLSVAVSPETNTTMPTGDRYLASGHQDQTIRIWHLPSGKIVHTLRDHSNVVWSVAFSPNGEWLISGSADMTIKLWQWRTGRLLQTFVGHTNWVWIVACSPDNLHFASGSYDQTIKIWNLRTGECCHTLSQHASSTNCLDFSPDGKMLATGGLDNTIRLWSVETGECLRLLTDHTNSIWSIKFSPRGRYFASASFDCTIKLWDTATHACMRTLVGHPGFVKTLQFTPNGRWLVSGGFNGEIKVWEVESGQCLATLEEHTSLIYLLDVAELPLSPGAAPRLLAFCGNYDETIKVWDLDAHQLLYTWKPPRPYENMSIANISGLNESQIATLMALGATG
jgi:WD40 repeat protein